MIVKAGYGRWQWFGGLAGTMAIEDYFYFERVVFLESLIFFFA
jgi:hypothetical protein